MVGVHDLTANDALDGACRRVLDVVSVKGQVGKVEARPVRALREVQPLSPAHLLAGSTPTCLVARHEVGIAEPAEHEPRRLHDSHGVPGEPGRRVLSPSTPAALTAAPEARCSRIATRSSALKDLPAERALSSSRA